MNEIVQADNEIHSAMSFELPTTGFPAPYQADIRRWYTPSRWYYAAIVRDLLGDWTVVRRWGGRNNQLYGQMIEVVANYQAAYHRLDMLDSERRKRQYQPWVPGAPKAPIPVKPATDDGCSI